MSQRLADLRGALTSLEELVGRRAGEQEARSLLWTRFQHQREAVEGWLAETEAGLRDALDQEADSKAQLAKFKVCRRCELCIPCPQNTNMQTPIYLAGLYLEGTIHS